MLEVTIIICLGIALFLLLRHYPETGERNLTVESRERVRKIFSYLKRFKHEKNMQEMQAVIEEDQGKIIAPIEIENATQKFGEKDPEVAELLHKAEVAISENDLRQAENDCLEAISKNKRSPYAYLTIGVIAFTRGQFEDAKEALKTAIKCNRDLGEAYYYLGKIDFRNENLSGAIENFQRSIYIEKGHADWYGELGKAYMEVRQYAKAAKVLKRAASLDIDNKEYKELASEAEDKQKSHSLYSRNR